MTRDDKVGIHHARLVAEAEMQEVRAEKATKSMNLNIENAQKEFTDTIWMKRVLLNPQKHKKDEVIAAAYKDSLRRSRHEKHGQQLPADVGMRMDVYLVDAMEKLNSATNNAAPALEAQKRARASLEFEEKAQRLRTGCPAACLKCPVGSKRGDLCAKVDVEASPDVQAAVRDTLCSQDVWWSSRANLDRLKLAAPVVK